MFGALVTGLGQGAVLALLAVGLVLVYKGSRVLNLAQGEIGGAALLTAYALTGHGTGNPVVMLLLAVVLAAALGLVIEVSVMRRLVGRPPIQGTIAALGLAIILVNATALLDKFFLPAGQSSYPVSMPQTVGTWSVRIGGATLVSGRVVAVIATAIVAGALFIFFTRTRFGLAVVAATSDDTVARILGIPVRRVYLFTWGVGGALSGLAAALVAPVLGTFSPATMTFVLISALAAAVVGGLDSIWGAIVGGLLIGVVQSLARHFFSNVGAVDTIAVLVLVIATLTLRPRGLLGGAVADA